MEAVYGAVFSAVFLHEKMSVRMIVGSAMIVASAFINGVGGRNNEVKDNT